MKNLGKQGFHEDIKELFDPMAKVVTDSNRKIHEEIKFNTKINDGMDESNIHAKALELMNENGVIHSSLIRSIAELPKTSK